MQSVTRISSFYSDFERISLFYKELTLHYFRIQCPKMSKDETWPKEEEWRLIIKS